MRKWAYLALFVFGFILGFIRREGFKPPARNIRFQDCGNTIEEMEWEYRKAIRTDKTEDRLREIEKEALREYCQRLDAKGVWCE